ncbi:MAG TPA: glycosyltransferase [Pyrinomonadaceae bacterium]|jgi:glycosyltransferase involved in cell wall biosynthesis|nr:glycosyltransferase [Pyrinomonadaceae bacterium]
MIHFITWLPLPYQQVLCRTLHQYYGSNFIVWYGETRREEFPFAGDLSGSFQKYFLDQCGYRKLAANLFRDKQAVVILGGWRSPMSARVLGITTLLGSSVLLWADHPHPRERGASLRLVRNLYLKTVNKVVSGFLACGKPTVEHLHSLGLTREKIANFPYWTELPESWELPAGTEISDPRATPLRLVGVGRFAGVKGFDVAIEAVSLANKRAGYRQVELLLAGDGPEGTTLQDLAKAMDCEAQVRFGGWLEPEQVQQAIRDADALVIPSKFEPYGVVVLEAMAAGRPVLASDGVIAALDRDDGTGAILFHPAGDAETLSRQIASLAENRSGLGRASLAARLTAEKWPTSRAIEILDEMIAKTRAGKDLIKQRTVLSAAK